MHTGTQPHNTFWASKPGHDGPIEVMMLGSSGDGDGYVCSVETGERWMVSGYYRLQPAGKVYQHYQLSRYEQDRVLAGWQVDLPTEPGLYAVREAVEGAGINPYSICSVTEAADGGMIYGGWRRVEHAPFGTLWHRLADLPA